jgi:hypothetical protein
VIACKIFNAAIPGSFALLGEEAAGDALVVVTVMRYACAAFPVVGALEESAGTGTIIITVYHRSHLFDFLYITAGAGECRSRGNRYPPQSVQ